MLKSPTDFSVPLMAQELLNQETKSILPSPRLCSCLLVQGHFFQLSAILIKLGNIKTQLTDLTLVLLAVKGIAKSLFVFLPGWRGWGKGHKPFLPPGASDGCVRVLHSGGTGHTQGFRLPRQQRKNNPVFHGIAGCLLWNNFLNRLKVVSPLPEENSLGN